MKFIYSLSEGKFKYDKEIQQRLLWFTYSVRIDIFKLGSFTQKLQL